MILRGSLLLLLLLCACEAKGGSFSVEIAMPPPSVPASPAGIMLDPRREDVCGEAHAYLYRGRDKALDVNLVPRGVAPVLRARAGGKYTADKTTCVAAASGLEPASDYWLVVRLPANLYNLHNVVTKEFAVTGGLSPIVVREGQETRGVLSIELRPEVKDIEPPGSR